MTKSNMALIALSSLHLAGCGSIDFGDALLDTAFVAADAYEIKECRTTYRMTGDVLRLETCEADVLQ